MKSGIKLGLVSLMFVFAVLLNWWWPMPYADEPEVHYHAGLVVYVNGERQRYQAAQHMNYSLCSDHYTKKSSEEEQLEKAHLHDMIDEVVHVHRGGATWGDLVSNARLGLPTQEVMGYVEGVRVENILSLEIVPDSSVALVVGEMPQDIEYVEQSYIKEIGQKSELCASN
jgi:hypothetical protein